MAHVFISYSRRDSKFVGALGEALRGRGKDVWIDIKGIRDAEVFPDALREAIESSDGFVFVISPASVQSPYCRREIEDAVDSGKRIVPIDWQPVSEEELPEPIRVRNWIPANGDLDATVERVAKALDTDLEYLREHTHWELKALEWEGKARDHSLLLRGTELAAAEAWLASAEAKDPAPTPIQREFLTVSRQAAANRQRRVAIGAVAIAAVSIALLVFALIQRGQAQSATQTMESRATALASEAQATVDPERALLLAMQAVKTRATPDALFALRAALDADPLVRRFAGYGAQTCPEPSPGVSISPNGILAIGLCSGRIILVGRNGRVITTRTQVDPAAPLRFNPNGSTLAVASYGRIRLYDPYTLSPLASLRVPGYAQRLVFSGDGFRMAATSTGATRSFTSVWDTLTGQLTMRNSERAPTNGLSTLVRGVGFVDQGRALAVGSPSGPVTVYASNGGRRLRTLADRQDALIGVDPDGRHLVVGGYHTRGAHSHEGVVTLWNTSTWRNPRVVASVPSLRPRNIVVSPDATRVAVGWSDGSAATYSLVSNAQVANFLGPPKPVSQIAWSPDGRTVAVGSTDGSVRVWRGGGVESDARSLGARMDWDQPAVTNKAITVITPPGTVRKLAVRKLDPITTFHLPLPRNARYSNGWLSPSGKTAVLVRTDGLADVWDLQRRSRIRSLAALGGTLAAFSNDDRRMLLLDGLHNELVDIRTDTRIPLPQRARNCRGQWQGARFSADGSTVVAGAVCGEIMSWNARTGKLLRRTGVNGQITGLALTGDGRTLAVASPDGRITVLNLETGAQHTIPKAPRGINSLAIGAGDRTLAAGVDDNTIRIWDVKTKRLLRVVTLPAPATARFTPDGKQLIAAQLTGVLKAIDPCPLCENASGLMALARDRVTRKLTAAERRTYLSGS
jgi:WD40 repeat protein